MKSLPLVLLQRLATSPGPRINFLFSDQSNFPAGPANALLMRALQLSMRHAPLPLAEVGMRK